MATKKQAEEAKADTGNREAELEAKIAELTEEKEQLLEENARLEKMLEAKTVASERRKPVIEVNGQKILVHAVPLYAGKRYSAQALEESPDVVEYLLKIKSATIEVLK